MAADILIYKANFVPVGEDQIPHIDITNEIVKKFNRLFGETFDPVKPYLTEGAKIMSLQDPQKKMSKTGDEAILLLDSPDKIKQKIKKAVTDSGHEIIYDLKRKPAISNLILIYHLLSEKRIEEIEKEYEGKDYLIFKNDLFEIIINFLKPFQERYRELMSDIGQIYSILEEGEKKAKEIAENNLKEIKQKIGLIKN